jgi:hypothetical protein
MVGKRDSVDRADYIFNEVYARVADEHGHESLLRDSAREHVEKEDERIWAHYRDPRTDLTQVEARDRAQELTSVDYPPRANISQATVSRKITALDDRMLTEQLALLDVREREGEHDVPGFLSRSRLDTLDRGRFTDLLDHYREALARFLVDLDALDRFERSDVPTPVWARDRFDDLDPTVGREIGLYDDITPDDEIHPPLDELNEQHGSRRHASTD